MHNILTRHLSEFGNRYVNDVRRWSSFIFLRITLLYVRVIRTRGHAYAHARVREKSKPLVKLKSHRSWLKSRINHIDLRISQLVLFFSRKHIVSCSLASAQSPLPAYYFRTIDVIVISEIKNTSRIT